MEVLLQEIDDGEHREIFEEFIEIINPQKAKKIVYWCKLSNYTLDNHTLPYNTNETLALHLSLQLAALEKRGFTLFFWEANDIWVINNGECFLLGNLEQIVPLYNKDPSQLLLRYPTIFPFPQNKCAPEVLKMAALPFITHRSASYYSVALLCLQEVSKANLSLEQIQGTKLFYFLERCLKENPKERLCLPLF